ATIRGPRAVDELPPTESIGGVGRRASQFIASARGVGSIVSYRLSEAVRKGVRTLGFALRNKDLGHESRSPDLFSDSLSVCPFAFSEDGLWITRLREAPGAGSYSGLSWRLCSREPAGTAFGGGPSARRRT